MAQQAARKQAETAPPVARAPRVPGSKTGKTVDYSRYRLTFTDGDAFMAFMRTYPNPEGITLFLYRLLPKIDLSLVGVRESNIQKGGYDDLKLYSPEAIAEKFGRGKYQIKVTDSNRQSGEQEVVRSCHVNLMDAEKPPVYDVRTLQLANADNIDEVNRLIASGVLVREPSGAPRLRTAADAMADPLSAAAPVAASPFGSSDIFGQIVLAAINKGSQSPHDVVKDTIEVARLIAPPPSALPSLDQIADAVATRLGGAGRGRDPFESWERVQGFVDKVRGPVAAVGAVGEAAAAAGEPGASWAPHLTGILGQLRSLIPEVGAMLRDLRTNGTQKNGAPVENGGQQKPMTMEQRIEQVFRLGYQRMQEGVTGFDFAVYVYNFMPGGAEVYRTLEPTGAAGLIALAAMNAEARPVVNDPAVRPQLEAFLSDFFSFDPDGGIEEPSETVTASA